ncbi:MAG: bacterial Ig-like domain-containing protein [Bacilli bacterium]
MERSAGFSFKNMRYGLMAIILALAFGSFSVIETPDNPTPAQTVKKLGEVASIAIETPPTQTKFPLGSEFDFTGLSIEVTDMAADTEIITEGFTLSGGDSLLLGGQTITVAYESAQTDFSIDVTNEAAIISGTLTFEDQATSYAVYIMYGIGMNAASDYFNVFYELQAEYGFMASESKAYFLQNRNHEISGINESGKLVTNTYNDAIGRYNYLAAKTGHPGLTADNTPSWLNAETLVPIAVFTGIVAVAGALYFVIKRKWSL